MPEGPVTNWYLREVRRVTKRFKTGEIHSTESCGHIWVTDRTAEELEPGLLLCSVSTSSSKACNFMDYPRTCEEKPAVPAPLRAYE